jgi:hypothetical protein
MAAAAAAIQASQRKTILPQIHAEKRRSERIWPRITLKYTNGKLADYSRALAFIGG